MTAGLRGSLLWAALAAEAVGWLPSPQAALAAVEAGTCCQLSGQHEATVCLFTRKHLLYLVWPCKTLKMCHKVALGGMAGEGQPLLWPGP